MAGTITGPKTFNRACVNKSGNGQYNKIVAKKGSERPIEITTTFSTGAHRVHYSNGLPTQTIGDTKATARFLNTEANKLTGQGYNLVTSCTNQPFEQLLN
jgi:hypothetical protein